MSSTQEVNTMTCGPGPDRLVPNAHRLLKRFRQEPAVKSPTVGSHCDSRKYGNYNEFSLQVLSLNQLTYLNRHLRRFRHHHRYRP